MKSPTHVSARSSQKDSNLLKAEEKQKYQELMKADGIDSHTNSEQVLKEKPADQDDGDLINYELHANQHALFSV